MQSLVERHSIISATERPIWKELGHDSSTNNLIRGTANLRRVYDKYWI